MTTQQRIERIANEKAEAFRLWVSAHRSRCPYPSDEFVLQQLIQQALTEFAEETENKWKDDNYWILHFLADERSATLEFASYDTRPSHPFA